MGSRIMHYCITTRLGEAMEIDDPQFWLGGIAPDVHKHMQEPKAKSHFGSLNSQGLMYSDYEAFGAKYFRDRIHPFHLGYYYHLISDQLWLEAVYYPLIKWLPQPRKKIAQESYYRDFGRLNGRLIDHYGLKLASLEVLPVEIDEIDYRYLPALIQDLVHDFESKDEHQDEPLELLEWNQVIHILDRTVQVCLKR
ncbi:hypothetical protein [Paenibacillus xylaniclasticus]|uniref:hypothetical protein n=1 Tax=Paenibacillus xylaniclasticus TaxID=588083 RepID=UPI000FDAC60E|nr:MULTISPECIES: hypothetical protein [Paenibacillus]GFN30273.1 hypothetical protein PCURB6_05330 [Paenibacillus curdlanolyticus]